MNDPQNPAAPENASAPSNAPAPAAPPPLPVAGEMDPAVQFHSMAGHVFGGANSFINKFREARKARQTVSDLVELFGEFNAFFDEADVAKRIRKGLSMLRGLAAAVKPREGVDAEEFTAAQEFVDEQLAALAKDEELIGVIERSFSQKKAAFIGALSVDDHARTVDAACIKAKIARRLLDNVMQTLRGALFG